MKSDGYVYFIKEFHSNTYKIGKAKNLENRLKIFEVKLPFEWELVHSIKSDDYSLDEKLAHLFFKKKRVRGEWFNLNESDLELIKRKDFHKRLRAQTLETRKTGRHTIRTVSGGNTTLDDLIKQIKENAELFNLTFD